MYVHTHCIKHMNIRVMPIFLLLAFFVLLPFPLGRGDVFCAKDSLIDAYENPTSYCQLSGMSL